MHRSTFTEMNLSETATMEPGTPAIVVASTSDLPDMDH